MVFHGSMVNLEDGVLSVWHETYLVKWSSMDLWSLIGGGGVVSVCHETDLV